MKTIFIIDCKRKNSKNCFSKSWMNFFQKRQKAQVHPFLFAKTCLLYTSLAQKVIAEDDEVDDMFVHVRDELVQMLKKEESEPAAVIDVMMIAKYFERIGDHATNIAEWVAFSITGRHE